MSDIEEKIKGTKSKVPQLSTDFSQRVLSQIEELESVIQPWGRGLHWIKLLFGLALLIIGLVAVNNSAFELRMNGSLEMLYFGTQFLNDMLKYIPWDIILPALLITGIASWLIWNSHLVKRGIALTIAVCYLVTGVGGVALANSGMNEQLQTQIVTTDKEWPLLSWFYKERARFFVRHPNFNMGQVVQSDDRSALVVDPYGNELRVMLPPQTVVKNGQYLRIRGEKGGKAFMATDVHFCGAGSVGRYFNRVGMMPDHMNKNRLNRGMMRQHRMMHRRRKL
jgi:hypothetical protein